MKSETLRSNKTEVASMKRIWGRAGAGTLPLATLSGG